MIPIIVVIATLLQLVLCKTVYYDWNVTYTHAAPDGFLRRVIGINNQWPCPQLDVDLGDEVVVNLYNALPDQSVSMHWHGIHQNGTNEMDGAVGFVQCPVPPGHMFTYRWKASRMVVTNAKHSNLDRLIKLAPTGTTLMTLANTPTACGVR